jgi:N-acetylmuramic acid 6-phosphate (MurNAc-6-P) etherase/N-acetylglucosamine kinase-like BadF-type ATPase
MPTANLSDGHTLVIDGGGTHTSAVLLNKKGEIVKTGDFGPGNLVRLSTEGARRLVEQIKDRFDIRRPGRLNVLAGFAGIGGPTQRAAIERIFHEVHFSKERTHLLTDVALAQKMLGSGVVVIGGTGTIAAGDENGKTAREGGNGPILDDRGSAYDIGCQALNATVNQGHGAGRVSSLGERLLDYIRKKRLFKTQPQSVKELPALVMAHSEERDKIASLARIVASCAAEGDIVAIRIMEKAAKSLADLASHASEMLGWVRKRKFGFRGGLFLGRHAQKFLITPIMNVLRRTGLEPEAVVLESRRDRFHFLGQAGRNFQKELLQKKTQPASSEPALRTTEQSHTRSVQMDRMTARQLVSVFNEANDEVLVALKNRNLLNSLDELRDQILSRNGPRIVMGGAGTSGRIARILARLFPEQNVVGWIAGGTKAETEAVEGAEDDTKAARREIAKLIREAQRAVFIGISCGLSAPCVAAGLLAARNMKAFLSVFGMTKLQSASANVGPNGLSFKMMTDDLRRHEANRFVPLTVEEAGPEVLQGSTRMKGGTATWIVFAALLQSLEEERVMELPSKQRPKKYRELTRARSASEIVESEIQRLRASKLDKKYAKFIDKAATALENGGNIIYVASGEHALAAKLDASEMPPTFGVSSKRVQVHSSVPKNLSPHDLVVFVGGELPPTRARPKNYVQVDTPDFITTKLALNTITTGAFTRAGYVIGNRMVNVQITNVKLFDRAVRIISEVAGVDKSTARRSLIASLLEKDEPSEADLKRKDKEFGKYSKPGTVPLAILHAGKIKLEEGRRKFEKKKNYQKVIAAQFKKAA